MASLSLHGIKKSLGSNPILRGVDLSLTDGEFAVLVGPSGCGKSTLLRTVAGLEEPDEGKVAIGDRDVTSLPPRERDIAMVFQSYALYPHLTVRDNLAFGLRLRKTPENKVSERVTEVAQMLSLEALLDRFPREMSGGQRQRVAMGRAIARRPKVFLFDEPLSNLDAALRAQVRVEIKRLHASLGATMLYVTHDQVEAMTLADRLVILNHGRVEQQGPPLEVYQKPSTRFVASFLGSPAMNFLPVTLSPEGHLVASGLKLPMDPLRFKNSISVGQSLTLGLRPHDLSAAEDGGITAVIDVVEAMGFEAFAHATVGSAGCVARFDGRAKLPVRGERVRFGVDPGAMQLFDPETGVSLAR